MIKDLNKQLPYIFSNGDFQLWNNDSKKAYISVNVISEDNYKHCKAKAYFKCMLNKKVYIMLFTQQFKLSKSLIGYWHTFE